MRLLYSFQPTTLFQSRIFSEVRSPRSCITDYFIDLFWLICLLLCYFFWLLLILNPPRKFRNVFFNTIIFVVQAKVYNLFIICEVNECQISPNLCTSLSTCENNWDSYYCKCPGGYNKKAGAKDQCEGGSTVYNSFFFLVYSILILIEIFWTSI